MKCARIELTTFMNGYDSMLPDTTRGEESAPEINVETESNPQGVYIVG